MGLEGLVFASASRTQVKYQIKKPTPDGMGFLIGSLAVSYFSSGRLTCRSDLTWLTPR